MAIRTAEAEWRGTLRDGNGKMAVGSGAFQGSYSYGTRFEEEPGTNPEELIGAAHAGCFSMALAGELGSAGYRPERVQTIAKVHLDRGETGFTITRIELHTTADVPGMPENRFRECAEAAKAGCPVSRALRGSAEIMLEAHLA